MRRYNVLIGVAIGVLASCGWSAADQERRDPPASIVLIAGVVGGQAAYGCGVIIAEHRSTVTILTAAHNLQIQRAAFITVAGERLPVDGSRVVPGHDLALVTAGRPWRSYAVAQLASQPTVGSRVHVWGPIKDMPFTPHEGVVREIDPRLSDPPQGAFAIDCAACNHGDSGTGVFNARDELIGVVTSAYFAEKQRLFVLGESYRPDPRVASTSGSASR